jgi:dienelactone hydrolase
MSAAIIICPGGGYHKLGKQVTESQDGSMHGITAVVLEYHLPDGRSSVPALDAHRYSFASNAVKWQVVHRESGIMGFSAGGHMAATAGCTLTLNPDAVDIVDRASC